MAFTAPIPLAVPRAQLSAKCTFSPARLPRFRCTPGVMVRMQSSTLPAETKQSTSAPESTSRLQYICANCRTPLPPELPGGQCENCGRPYVRRPEFVDLTFPAKRRPASLFDSTPLSQRIFESPFVAFAYERGWRNNFRVAGFPGPEAEAAMALDYVKKGGTLLEASCGTGVLTRVLVRDGDFQKVVAIDYSENMLREAARRGEKAQFERIRADIASLPFADESVDKVVSGAALHCWPKVQDGLAEIYRVLAPNGRLFATTFLKGGYLPQPLAQSLLRVVGRPRRRVMAYRFFEKEELLWLCRSAGFREVEVDVNRGFVTVRCQK